MIFLSQFLEYYEIFQHYLNTINMFKINNYEWHIYR